MRVGLYQKFFIWGFFNLFFLAAIPLVLVGWLLLGPSEKIYPPSWFSDNIHAQFREISMELQYRTLAEWGEIIDKHSSEDLDFYLVGLTHQLFIRKDAVPNEVLDLARRIPRPPYDLCLEESVVDGKVIKPFSLTDIQAGLAPDAGAVFLYSGEPRRFWFARPLFIMGEDDIPNIMLLAAASPSITGYGMFFNLKPPLTIFLIMMALTFFWWLPFVMHITRPLEKMTGITEKIAGGDYSQLKIKGSAPSRKDEIGRLTTAIEAMAEQVSRKVQVQQSFLRYIAHELGSPLTRIKLGLAVIEDQVEPGIQERLNGISADVEAVENLTQDVISYLRAETFPDKPHRETVLLLPLLQRIVEKDGQGGEVRMEVEEGLAFGVDVEFFCRAVSNVIRNAVKYAGKDGPITVRGRREGEDVLLDVLDQGPGVPEAELGLILQPFYRGKSSTGTSGTGLGLAIVRNSVELMGGSVLCRNRSPRGFSVDMRFPV